MSPSVFRRALESVKDWPGVIGVFGGNPCTHPHFPELCGILRELVPQQSRRGLWANSFLEHGAIVAETFFPRGRFNLNAHGERRAAAQMERWTPGKVIPESGVQESMHAGILMDRQDLGMPDEEWVQLREACDINRNWSAGIVEKDGQPWAYFCEVAAALDGVRGLNHGIPATPGWWRKPIAVFAGQIAGCCDQGCGVPLRHLGHRDTDRVYDVTASWAKIVRPRRRLRVQVHDGTESGPGTCEEATDYMRMRSCPVPKTTCRSI